MIMEMESNILAWLVALSVNQTKTVQFVFQMVSTLIRQLLYAKCVIRLARNAQAPCKTTANPAFRAITTTKVSILVKNVSF